LASGAPAQKRQLWVIVRICAECVHGCFPPP
jgi:hypothetical protein